MVVKTELCSFSESRVYPGHGMRFIRRDGQSVFLGSSKARHMLNQRKKPAKLVWTLAWRRLNKKVKDEHATKKKARKIVKAPRAIVGATLDDLRMKKQPTKKVSAATEAALKEVKARNKSSTTANKSKNTAAASKGKPISNHASGGR